MAEAPMAKIALALAASAVVIVSVVAISIGVRGKPPSTPVALAAMPSGPAEIEVAAHDVVRIDRSTVDAVTRGSSPVGIKINDAELRSSLKLDADDVIVAISGKPVRRQFDVYDALLGASMMNATTLYVELERDGTQRLVKWQLDGDLREARTGVVTKRVRAPAITAGPDPLADTVKKTSTFTFTLPRSTFDQLGANAIAGSSLGVRAVSGFRGGNAEGIKLFSIRPGSVWEALGLQSGDTVTMANGRGLDLSRLRDDFEALRTAATFDLEVLRAGAAIRLTFAITP